MITPYSKDLLLSALCSDEVEFEQLLDFNLKSLLKIGDFTFNELFAILKQFERLGFVSEINIRNSSSSAYFCVHLEALDFKNRGGFIGQEKLLKGNIKKLILEIESLEPSLKSKIESTTTIISSIKNVLDLIVLGVNI